MDVTFDPSKYGFVEHEGLMVVAGNGGRKYIALHIVSPTQGYLYWSMRNLKIEEVASAMAPDVVTELVAESELVSRLTMKAPAVDYAGRPLDGLAPLCLPTYLTNPHRESRWNGLTRTPVRA